MANNDAGAHTPIRELVAAAASKIAADLCHQYVAAEHLFPRPSS